MNRSTAIHFAKQLYTAMLTRGVYNNSKGIITHSETDDLWHAAIIEGMEVWHVTIRSNGTKEGALVSAKKAG